MDGRVKNFKKRYIISNIVLVIIFFVIGIYYNNPIYIIAAFVFGIYSVYFYKKNEYWYFSFISAIDPNFKRKIFLILLGFFIASPLLGFLFNFIEGKEFEQAPLGLFVSIISLILFIIVFLKKPKVKKKIHEKINYKAWIFIALSLIMSTVAIFFVEFNKDYVIPSFIVSILFLIIACFTIPPYTKKFNNG